MSGRLAALACAVLGAYIASALVAASAVAWAVNSAAELEDAPAPWEVW